MNKHLRSADTDQGNIVFLQLFNRRIDILDLQRHGALAEYWSEGSAEHVIITSISHERLIHRYYTGDEAARIEGDEKQRLEEERQQQEQNKEIGEGQPPADGEITTIDDVTETGGGQ